jgi:5-methylcytosine-specific restriction endonuclease McrA
MQKIGAALKSNAQVQREWFARQSSEKQANLREQTRLWHIHNREQSRKLKLEHYHRNKETYLDRQAQRLLLIRSDPNLLADYKARRKFSRTTQKAKRRQWAGDGTLTRLEWQCLLEAHEYKCFYCKRSNIALEQDHWIPLSKGGEHSLDNVVPACGDCNRRKNAQDPLDFIVKDLEK